MRSKKHRYSKAFWAASQRGSPKCFCVRSVPALDAYFGKKTEQVVYGLLPFFLACDVKHRVPRMEHKEPVTVVCRKAKIVRYHYGGQLFFAHDAVGELHYELCRPRVESRGVLVEYQNVYRRER